MHAAGHSQIDLRCLREHGNGLIWVRGESSTDLVEPCTKFVGEKELVRRRTAARTGHVS